MPSDVPKIKVATPHKRWHKSRTLWINAALLGLELAETQLHFLQPALPVNVHAVFAFALPVINGVLRVVTKQGLTK